MLPSSYFVELKHMIAEIIAIGSELTTGAKLDTNSQWLSLELGVLGIPVHYHTTMADETGAMIAAFRAAVNRSDLVLITGGLGPTLDDLTRQALAGLTNTELVLHQPSLEHIQSLFARRNRAMPERNVIQAMFPEGSEPISNPRGSAPGIWLEVSRKSSQTTSQVVVMPGVPSEMKRMFQHEVLPRLPGGGRVIRRARINCFGVGESHAEEMLGELTARGRDPEVGITVHEATITLRITSQAELPAQCDEKIAATERIIREKMGDLVFGIEDEELQHAVARILNERELTLAVAESGTGGLLAHRLTEVEGFKGCFLGGVVVPTSEAKQNMLSVDAAILNSAGPISAETAGAMAEGCRHRFGTDFSLAVTECPDFDPDNQDGDPPSIYVALAGENLLRTEQHTLLGDPAITKSRVAKAAFNLLRLHLLRGNR